MPASLSVPATNLSFCVLNVPVVCDYTIFLDASSRNMKPHSHCSLCWVQPAVKTPHTGYSLLSLHILGIHIVGFAGSPTCNL